MRDSRDQAMAALLARLAAREMLGFQMTRGAAATVLTKVGSGKLGVLKPPPSGAQRA